MVGIVNGKVYDVTSFLEEHPGGSGVILDEAGQDSYNPPSLRGLPHRGRFLHDNRARSLSRALELHRPAAMKDLPDTARSDLLSFLLSL